MIDFKIEVEGYEELFNRWRSETDALKRDLHRATISAAERGIEEAQRNHPYTDRTTNLSELASGEDNATGEAGSEMVWPMEYASFVDRGTRRNRPYPFTPQATKAATEELQARAQDAINAFIERFNR